MVCLWFRHAGTVINRSSTFSCQRWKHSQSLRAGWGKAQPSSRKCVNSSGIKWVTAPRERWGTEEDRREHVDVRGYRQPRELSEDMAVPKSLLLRSKSAFAWISAMAQLHKRPKGWSGRASSGAEGWRSIPRGTLTGSGEAVSARCQVGKLLSKAGPCDSQPAEAPHLLLHSQQNPLRVLSFPGYSVLSDRNH